MVFGQLSFASSNSCLCVSSWSVSFLYSLGRYDVNLFFYVYLFILREKESESRGEGRGRGRERHC